MKVLNAYRHRVYLSRVHIAFLSLMHGYSAPSEKLGPKQPNTECLRPGCKSELLAENLPEQLAEQLALIQTTILEMQPVHLLHSRTSLSGDTALIKSVHVF